MNNTNLIRRTLLCLSIIAASNSWAASSSYQSEVGLNYVDRDNSETYFVSGEYFFVPVLTEAHPLAEANFFSRSASISGFIGSTDTDTGSFNFDTDAINILYSYAKKTSSLTFGIGYTQRDSDITGGGLSGNAGDDQYTFNIGYYLTSNSHLKFIYLNTDGTFSHPDISNTTSESTAYSLQYKNIFEFSDNTALGITGLISSAESSTDVTAEIDGTRYDIIADYYFNRGFNLSGRLASISSNAPNFDGTEFGLDVGYFVTESFHVIGSYSEFDSTEGGSSDTDLFAIKASYRF